MLLIFIFNIILYPLSYDLNLEINPYNSYLNSTSSLKLDGYYESIEFYLNKHLKISEDREYQIDVIEKGEIANKYSVKRKDGKRFNNFKIYYQGKIFNPFEENKEEYQRSFRETKGIISEDGCYLSNSTYYYPLIQNFNPFKFKAEVKLPSDYKTVLPGIMVYEKKEKEYRTEIWEIDEYSENISLVCGKFNVYYNKSMFADIYVYLRNQDNDLAKRYIEWGKIYLETYTKLIGKYPYKKFAVVENFYETGYGFESFTLIGPTVLRFPFLVVSSYPHEILHNWWGNGVFVDYNSGNWSEGLTAYLSDHLLAENRNKGVDYRKDTLAKYTYFVNEKNEFLLSEFKERHSGASEAVGYGKALMFFHMLRKKYGDDTFIKALKDFYKRNIFKTASWYDLKFAFEKYTKDKEIDRVFERYINKKGLESITISEGSFNEKNGNYEVSFKLSQSGNFFMDIPVFIIYEDYSYEVFNFNLGDLNERKITIDLSSKPIAVVVDLMYDLPRRLNDGEVPATLVRINGADNLYFYIKDERFKDFIEPYKYKKYTVLDKVYELSNIKGEVWVVGKDIELLNEICIKNNCDIKFEDDGVWIDNIKYEFNKNSFVLSFLNPYNKKHTINFFVPLSSDCVKNIAFKIPHYSKYSYLVFDEAERNIISGVWKLKESPNIIVFGSFDPEKLKLSSKPLIKIRHLIDETTLKKDIYYLSKKLKTRHPGSLEIKKAADYIENRLSKTKVYPFFDKFYREGFLFKWDNKKIETENICGMIKGEKDLYLFLTAHYDHLFPQNEKYYPGANDNASGVGLVMSVADYYSKNKPKTNIVFCFFSAEEEGRIGSKYFVDNLSKDILSKTIAAINIDTVGRIEREVYILNSFSSSKWQGIIKSAALRTMIDYKISTLPLDSSDHISFIEKKIPAIQIFDGGTLDYHTPYDTYDKLNFSGILVAGDFVINLINEVSKYSRLDFVENEVPRTVNKRKVSLGFMPDFGYSGKGVRIKKLNENSILKNKGIKEGDIILKVNGIEIDNLITYTNILSEVDEKVTLEFFSDNERKIIELSFH